MQSKVNKNVTNKYHALLCQILVDVLPMFYCVIFGAFFTGVSGQVFKFRVLYSRDENSIFEEISQRAFSEIEYDVSDVFDEFKNYFNDCGDDFSSYTIVIRKSSNGLQYNAYAERISIRYLDTAVINAWKEKYLS